jgi:hypothetical protein
MIARRLREAAREGFLRHEGESRVARQSHSDLGAPSHGALNVDGPLRIVPRWPCRWTGQALLRRWPGCANDRRGRIARRHGATLLQGYLRPGRRRAALPLTPFRRAPAQRTETRLFGALCCKAFTIRFEQSNIRVAGWHRDKACASAALTCRAQPASVRRVAAADP